MKIEFERFNFKEGTVEKVEREIDTAAVLRGNAFYQMLSKKQDKRKCSRKNSSTNLKTK